jgi:hypothetical protein
MGRPILAGRCCHYLLSEPGVPSRASLNNPFQAGKQTRQAISLREQEELAAAPADGHVG